MAHPLRIEYPGALYHLTSRGDGREDIFLDDRERFFNILGEVVGAAGADEGHQRPPLRRLRPVLSRDPEKSAPAVHCQTPRAR